MIKKKLEEAEDFLNLGIVLNEKEEVLMIRRKEKEVGKDGSILNWAFPGGKQLREESREECIKRTIFTETGYDVESVREISLRWHPQFPVLVAYHLCKLVSEKPVAKPSEPHEIAEVKWVKQADIKNLITTDIDPDVNKLLGS